MEVRKARNVYTGDKVTILRVEDVPDTSNPNRRVVVYQWQGERQEQRWEEQDFWRCHR